MFIVVRASTDDQASSFIFKDNFNLNNNIMIQVISINNIKLISPDDEYYWEMLKENDDSDVYKIQLGNIHDKIITCLYGKGIFSIRYFNTTFEGGDSFYFKIPFEQTTNFIKSLVDGHNLNLMPIYHKSTLKVKSIKQ